MRIAWIALVAVALVPVVVYAQDGPEIQVSDGKVSMSAQAVPLGRLLSLWDRAVGMNSQVLKPELANRMVSVRFTNLELKDAVRKIFEGQPLNYSFVEGKGIRVIDAALSTAAASTGSTPVSSSSFPEPQQSTINSQPLAIGNAQPAQNLQNPQNPAGQPAQPANPFGNQPAPVPAANTNTNTGGAVVPGQLPPPIGANNNPLVAPANAAPAPAATGFPATPAPAPSQPTGPGAVGVTPGALPK